MIHIDPTLELVFLRYPADYRPMAITPLGGAGGFSGARFWRLLTPRGEFILRLWPTEHPTPRGLNQVHAVLRHAESRGLRYLPVPVLTLDGNSFVQHDNRLWELAPWLPGRADYAASPSTTKLRAAMIALGQFHRATADFVTHVPSEKACCVSPGIVDRARRLAELSQGGLRLLRESVDDAINGPLALPAREFLAPMDHGLALADVQLAPLVDLQLPCQPAIRDIWREHVLFEGERVTGLVDFGGIQIDTPLLDVARLLGSLAGDEVESWNCGLTAYASQCDLPPHARRAVAALDLANVVLGGCNWIRWIYRERRLFEHEERVRARLCEHRDRLAHVVDRGPLHRF